MCQGSNEGNPIAHAVGFRVIPEGIKKELASPSSIMQKDVSAFVKEELLFLLKHQLIRTSWRLCISPSELIFCVKSLWKCNRLIPLP